MENDEYLFENICRVCLNSSKCENMVNLLDKSSDDGLSCYGKAIEIFCNISVKMDGLPFHMCQNCLKILKQAIVLKKTCENSQEILKRATNNFELNIQEMKKKIIEFVLFKTYFPKEYLASDCDSDYNDKHDKTSNEKCVRLPELNTEESRLISLSNDHEFDDFSDLFQDQTSDLFQDQSSNETEMSPDDLLNAVEKVVKMDSKMLNNLINKNKKHTKLKRIRKETIYKQKIRERAPKTSRFVCKICDKSFARAGVYNWHKLKHNGRQYVCEVCGKEFISNGLLQTHQGAVHSIGKLYSCNQCDFKAPRKHELTEHIRLHTGERPFACDKCGLTFRRRYIWKKHALYHNEKTVQCPKCPRKFFQRGAMMAHYNSIHERFNIYKCSECDVTYAKPVTVRRHLTDKHGIPREKQGRIIKIKIGMPSIDI